MGSCPVLSSPEQGEAEVAKAVTSCLEALGTEGNGRRQGWGCCRDSGPAWQGELLTLVEHWLKAGQGLAGPGTSSPVPGIRLDLHYLVLPPKVD